jgi:MurNAc alpha-1-phosphate uridylyltransferase
MKAMILAAGRGERMRPLTDHTPKPLLKVNHKPLIFWCIEKLVSAGIHDIVVNVSHLAQSLYEALGQGKPWGANIQYSNETTALETAGGIAWALPLLDENPFLVINADVYTDYPFKQLIQEAQGLHANRLAHLVLVDNPAHHRQGDFGLQDTHVNFSSSTLTFSGVGAYHPLLFSSVARGEKQRLATLLKQPILQGLISGEHYQGLWSDVGTPQRLAELETLLSSMAKAPSHTP